MNEATPNFDGERKVNPSAIPPAHAARMLSAAGGQLVSVEMLEADVSAGAPTNADGGINLVHLAAWLVKEMAARGD